MGNVCSRSAASASSTASSSRSSSKVLWSRRGMAEPGYASGLFQYRSKLVESSGTTAPATTASKSRKLYAW